jgi:16S rRNA (guanine527-N7)-methyltransferase
MSYFEKQQSIFLSLGFREQALPQLKKYIDYLWSSNEELNLISRKMTIEELIDNHIIDSLLILSLFPTQAKKVADLGSGGGLPGVLLAMQYPEIEFHLFEKSPKKREFLEGCRKFLPNLYLQAEITIPMKGFDLITARAFKPIDVIIDMTSAYYKSGGKYFLMKARLEKIQEEIQDTQKKEKNFSCQIKPLKSPVLEVERHIVLIG